MANNNNEYTDSIAKKLEAICNGELYICPHCGEEFTYEELEERNALTDDGLVHFCPDCEDVELEEETMWEYFDSDGIYNIEYVVDSAKEYKACRIMVACGGPNIYINTWDKCVELYWWGSDAKTYLSQNVCSAIDEVFLQWYDD